MQSVQGLLPPTHWKFYDLGHGYCTYDFFEQCPHRTACAKCDFYMSTQSTAALLLEGKQHLLRLLQEIPLGDAEQTAVEEGVAAYEKLLLKLADVPIPAGPTQRQIGSDLVQMTISRPAVQPVVTAPTPYAGSAAAAGQRKTLASCSDST